MKQPGKVYLIPNGLSEDGFFAIPEYVKTIIGDIDCFVVENEKAARRLIIDAGFKERLNETSMKVLSKKQQELDFNSYLNPVNEGKNIGIISEAGCPAIADPGADLVRLAQQKNIQVVPLVGPSSILLALMASGLNGQSFAFHGYLPIKPPERTKKIKEIEEQSKRHRQTQLFIETPYRNNQMLETLVKNCKDSTDLCIAVNITGKDEWIKTKSIRAWKKGAPDLHKKPAVFLLLAK